MLSNRQLSYPMSIFLLIGTLLTMLMPAQVIAEPRQFTHSKEDFFDWPQSLAVGETFPLKGYRVYYDGERVVEREDVTEQLNFISLDENVLRVMPGNILEALAPGEVSLKVEDLEKRKIWTTSRKIAVAAEQFTVNTTERSKQEIEQAYERYKPRFTFKTERERFAEMPSATRPYQLGALNSEFVEDGMRMANFIRYLAGLPNRLKPDDRLNVQAQHGALVLAANDELTHEPTRPVGMRNSFYKTGFESTKSSNISSGVDTLSEQVVGFMDDLGLHNLSQVGHRRWILHPPLRDIGFGMAPTPRGHSYGVMQVFDTSDAKAIKVNYEFIAWPSAGWFPQTFFDAEAPWSVTPNPAIYDLEQSEKLSVTVTDQTNGQSWQLTGRDNQLAEQGEYFNVAISKGGFASAIVFRPSDIAFREGSLFNVVINGLVHRKEGPVNLSYQVKPFSLTNWELPDGWQDKRGEITNEESLPIAGQALEAGGDGPSGGTGGGDRIGANADNGLGVTDSGLVADIQSGVSELYERGQSVVTQAQPWHFLVAGLSLLIIFLLLMLWFFRSRSR